MKLGDLTVEAVVLSRVHLNLGLEVSEPLLLPLSAFQCGHAERS